MPRPKKYPDAEKTIAAFFSSVSDAFNHPSAGERSLDGHKPINLLAEEFGISRLKVRKILITTGDAVYPETARIQRILTSGKTKAQACVETGMAISTLNSFLPYEKGVYNLTDVSIYAESSRVYRERKEAVANLAYAIQYGTFEEQKAALWKTVVLFAGYPFVTSGRGSREGTKFKYEVSAPGEKGGRHYEGAGAGIRICCYISCSNASYSECIKLIANSRCNSQRHYVASCIDFAIAVCQCNCSICNASAYGYSVTNFNIA